MDRKARRCGFRVEVSDSTSWLPNRVTFSRSKGGAKSGRRAGISIIAGDFRARGDWTLMILRIPGPLAQALLPGSARPRRSPLVGRCALKSRGRLKPGLQRVNGTGRDQELDPGYDDERRVGRASSQLDSVEWLSLTIGWLPCPLRRPELLRLSHLIRFGRSQRTAPISSADSPNWPATGTWSGLHRPVKVRPSGARPPSIARTVALRFW